MAAQGEMLAQVKKILGTTTGTYNENMILLAQEEGSTITEYNGAMIDFLRGRLAVSDGSLNDLQAKFAAKFGFAQWNGLNQVIPDDYAVWIDADDSSKITFGTGLAIAAYTDKSGNGVSITQSTEASQPSYNATGLNSKGTFTFSADKLVTTSSFALTNGLTLFVLVPTITNTGTDDTIIGQYAASGSNKQFIIRKSAANVFEVLFSADGVNDSTITGDATSANQLLTFSHDGALGGGLYQNGVLKNITIADIKATGSATFTVAANNTSATSTFVGSIAAVILYTRLLSDNERIQVEKYLMNKYGLS